MDFLEKDLEKIIYEASKYKSGRDELCDRGLCINGKMKRQLRIGKYGVADLVTFERIFYNNGKHSTHTIVITVYELKKDKIGISAFLQAIGYLKGIISYLNKRNPRYDIIGNIKLIGRDINTHSTFSYIADLLPICENDNYFLMNYTYDYDIYGIKFNLKTNYYLKNEGF